ncbi:MAG: hypothetical protein WDO16_09075 [Bacteroidota bacterium]
MVKISARYGNNNHHSLGGKIFLWQTFISVTPSLPDQVGFHKANGHVLPAMEMQLKLKSYSRSTVRTCLNEMLQLIKLVQNRPVGQFYG